MVLTNRFNADADTATARGQDRMDYRRFYKNSDEMILLRRTLASLIIITKGTLRVGE